MKCKACCNESLLNNTHPIATRKNVSITGMEPAQSLVKIQQKNTFQYQQQTMVYAPENKGPRSAMPETG